MEYERENIGCNPQLKILVFGNPLVPGDSLPIRLLPELRKALPEIEFKEFDAVEELEDEGWDLVIIDSVEGISEIRVFDSPDSFSESPRFSLHDFDLPVYLKLLAKMGKVKKVTIIGVPAEACPVAGVQCPVSGAPKRKTGHRKLLTDLVAVIREIFPCEQPEHQDQNGAEGKNGEIAPS